MKYVRAGLKTLATLIGIALVGWGANWFAERIPLKVGFVMIGAGFGIFIAVSAFIQFLDAENKKGKNAED